MIVIPAIDIKDGNCVRLFKGDYATVHKVADNAVETALKFQSQGAEWLHMVDLDGAKDGRMVNSQLFIEVAKSTKLKIELGGGIRDMNSIEYYLKNGIERVILGSVAVKNPEFVRRAIKEYGDKIIVGIDAMDGMVKAEGWIDSSEINYIELAKRMEDFGVKTIIYTDIDQDGTLAGPNLNDLDKLSHAVSCDIVASGGVANLKDIINLAEIDIYGAICGKAIYTGDLDLKQAIQICSKV